ncbi:MAG: sigma-70 family RNA polymerase sigma factor, partial [Anaerolineae bacterium]
AADACQMAWIGAFRNLNSFRGGRLQSWLVRVLLNTCYDEVRRRNRRREVPLLPLNNDGEETEAGSWLVDRARGVEETVDAHEFENAIHQGLQSLLPVYRTMLILIDIEGMSYEEAAAAERVPMGTVRSRLARARMALRQRLQETTDLGPAPQRYQVLPPAETRLRPQ